MEDGLTPDALPPAAVEAGARAFYLHLHADDIANGDIQPFDQLDPAIQRAWLRDSERHLAAALPHLRAQWEGEIKAAFCEGYDTGSDPAWCEKQLRRAGVKAETWEPAATDYFWQGSEAAAALRAPTTSYPLSPEAQLSTDSLSEPTAPSGEVRDV